MSQEELEEAGILLPRDLWDHSQVSTTVNVVALIVAGILGFGSAFVIYLGDGSWLTWIGVFGYFVFLGFFLFISLRAINRQNERLSMLREKTDEDEDSQAFNQGGDNEEEQE